MLIDAFNKVCKETQLYNLQSSTSLADAVIKGLDAYQIHDLVNCYEQSGFDPNNKVDYTCWFEFCRTMRYGGNLEYVFIEYYCLNPYQYDKVIILCGNQVYDQTPAQRLEDVVDRVLTIIENKEWEKGLNGIIL